MSEDLAASGGGGHGGGLEVTKQRGREGEGARHSLG